MGLAREANETWFTIAETAAASVTTAPASSYRLFVDTDGLFKLKDDAGVVTTPGSAGGGGWETESTDAVKLETGRARIWDNALDGSIVLDGSITLLAGTGWPIEIQVDVGEVVEITSGDGLVLPSSASDPAGPSNGQIYYNSSTNKFRGRANGVWVDLH